MAESQKKARDALAQDKEASQKKAGDALEGNGAEEGRCTVPETGKGAAAAGRTAGNRNGAQAASGKREAAYTAEEFAANAEAIFRVKPECVQAAFREKGIKECTKSDAKKVVEDFMRKEVK